ncbi:MAG: hypothetical protein JNK64_06740 [Myxococcales bacterium]|nr:hypothetical protein [Myxococcales bacterium]
MRRVVALALVVLAGCPADDQSQPDAPGSAGVAVAWISDPAVVPGRVEDGFDLTAAAFHLRNLRVVGDAGSGDPRTTAPLVELGWSSEGRPGTIVFPDAPPGLYSRMLWTIDRGAGAYAYELHGTAQTGTGREPYAILDADPIAIDLDYQIVAEAGAQTTIVTRVDFDDVLDVVDFDAAPLIGGVRTITAGDPQLAVIRVEVRKAFGVHPSDQP